MIGADLIAVQLIRQASASRLTCRARPVEDGVRLQRRHLGVGVDAEIGAADDGKAVGFEEFDLAPVDVVDIGRQQTHRPGFQMRERAHDRLRGREAIDA